MVCSFKLLFTKTFVLLHYVVPCITQDGEAYQLISRMQTECELEALTAGTMLADRYNSMDEGTEWDIRIHNDYLVENLGFAGWIQMGLYGSKGKTPHNHHAPSLHRQGGWAGHKTINMSSFWALEDQWLYMMGDSTQRQIWATFVSPFQNNEFERGVVFIVKLIFLRKSNKYII